MKRYRVITVDFDSRAHFLLQQIQPEWEKHVKENWIENKHEITKSLITEFGESQYAAKINNFMEIGPKPFSVVAFHNRFFHQARYAFVIGSYYPALTGVCALGERILNHLILRLRDYFKATDQYKLVYRKDSFDNWDDAIDVLVAWNILRPDPVTHLQKLKALRNTCIHFDYSTDYKDREYALTAIKEMNEIIAGQFAAGGVVLPWFIPDTRGTVYIKKEYETDPFVKEIYLPNCALVGPNHRMEHKNGKWIAIDQETYETRNISDEEFVELTRKNGQA